MTPRAALVRWCAFVLVPALASAALFSACFPPTEQPIFAWIALAPLLASIAHGASGVQARAMGMLFGLALAAWNLTWLASVFGAAGSVFWIVFAAFPAIVLGTLANARERWGVPAALALSVPVWIGVEHFRSEVWPLRFGWLSSGYALAASDTWIQGADLGGVYGLGAASVAAAALLAGASVATARRRIALLVAALAIPAALAAYGAFRLGQPLAPATLRVAALQYETQSLDDARALLVSLPSDVRLIVGPELGAVLSDGVPSHLDAPGRRAALSALARERGAVIVIGGTRDAPGDSRLEGFYNSLAVTDADGTVAWTTKAEPVPLFADGARAAVVSPTETSIGTLGTAICYDATHSHVIEQLAPAAALLVVASGDLAAWTELQHVQHARMVRVRAVEHRRWVVRSTSSGVSQIIDPLGAIHAELGYGRTGSIEGTVALLHERTMRDVIGPWIPRGALVIAVLVFAALMWSHLRDWARGRRGGGDVRSARRSGA